MKKRIFSFFWTVLMFLSLTPITAHAMQIFVDINITGMANLSLEVESGDSIENVKQKIKEITGYNVEYQHLFFHDELENDRTLADYNVQRESTIFLELGAIIHKKNINLGVEFLDSLNRDVVYYGQYNQSMSDDGTYNINPIKWLVIDKTFGKAFLMSHYNLDAAPFNSEASTWEHSSLRSELNNNFLEDAFSEVEKEKILDTTLENNITDKIFLLSSDEAQNFPDGFLDNATRIAPNTAYANYNGASSSANSADKWWLRSMAPIGNTKALFVDSTGTINSDGESVTTTLPYRPAFNLDTNSVIFMSDVNNISDPDNINNFIQTSDYDGNEYKLTLLSNVRDDFSIRSLSRSDNSILFQYNNATTGPNEYISAIIQNNCTVRYYNNIKKVSTESDSNGTATITLPNDFDYDNGDRVYIFNEQVNSDYYTNYSSELHLLNINDIAVPDDNNNYIDNDSGNSSDEILDEDSSQISDNLRQPQDTVNQSEYNIPTENLTDNSIYNSYLKTGDNKSIVLWIILLFISGSILALTAYHKKKKKE